MLVKGFPRESAAQVDIGESQLPDARRRGDCGRRRHGGSGDRERGRPRPGQRRVPAPTGGARGVDTHPHRRGRPRWSCADRHGAGPSRRGRSDGRGPRGVGQHDRRRRRPDEARTWGRPHDRRGRWVGPDPRLGAGRVEVSGPTTTRSRTPSAPRSPRSADGGTKSCPWPLVEPPPSRPHATRPRLARSRPEPIRARWRSPRSTKSPSPTSPNRSHASA